MKKNLSPEITDANAFFNDIIKHPFLCQACGMCSSVCPQDAISFMQNEFSEYLPYLDLKKCVNCKKCMDACPVRKFDKNIPSVIGKFKKVLIAKSTDKTLNRRGSSGGVVTALAQFGINNDLFDEILSVDYINSKTVAEPKYFKKDISEASGSKYVAAPLCSIYDKNKKKLAVTALPCQAKAIKCVNPNSFVFGLFCSKISNEDLINFMVKNNIRKKNVKNVRFREGLWPGKFEVKFEDGEIISYKLNRSFFSAAYNSYLFTNSGCLLCDDYFAEYADISFGDPWGNDQYKKGYYGETIIIVRTERGSKLIEKAISEGLIDAKSIDISRVVRGHLKEIYHKKTAIKQRCDYVQNKVGINLKFTERAFVNTKSNKILNMYSIYNNWKIRENKSYHFFKKMPFLFVFFTRFAHAFLLSRFIKKSEILYDYIEIAKQEKTK